MKAPGDFGVDAGKTLAEVGSQAADFISQVTSSAQNSAAFAKRAVRQGLHATEDLIDETAYAIKKRPLRSVGVTLGIGLGAGVLLGWFAGRKCSATKGS